MFFYLSILLLLLSPTFLLLTRAGKDTQRLVLKQKPRRSTGQYRRTLDANLARQIQEEAVRLGSTCLLIISDREFNTDMPTVRLTWAFVSA